VAETSTTQARSSPFDAEEAKVATLIVAIARELAVELHPHLRRTLSAHIDSDLDRDLGLDSLGRAELLLRLDRSFKIKLPDGIIGEASSIRDLLTAVLSAAPDAGHRLSHASVEPAILPAVEAPSEAATLIEVLARHVRDRAERPHIRLWHGEAGEETITYAELDRSARCVARGLIERGLVVGDRVAIMLPTEAAFFTAFFGVLHAGGVPVPIYPPFRRPRSRIICAGRRASYATHRRAF
jgi:non-ribosomal peptide synthetase component F